MGGGPVGHWSWDDVRDLVQTARTNAKATERLWLDQLKVYMGEGHLKTIDLRRQGGSGGSAGSDGRLRHRLPIGFWNSAKAVRSAQVARQCLLNG